MNLIDQLNWRYATKEFDPSKKLSDSQLETVLETLRLAPSSFGLQPWHFLVVTDPDTREELVGHSWNQRQVADSSHLIVLCAPTKFSEQEIDAFIASTADTRGVPTDSLNEYAGMMKGFLSNMDDASIAAWIKDQIYLALGSLLTVCAIENIDACPMEGFSASEYDSILGLTEKGLRSAVLCPVGFRADSDKYATLAKVRYPREQVISFHKP